MSREDTSNVVPLFLREDVIGFVKKVGVFSLLLILGCAGGTEDEGEAGDADECLEPFVFLRRSSVVHW